MKAARIQFIFAMAAAVSNLTAIKRYLVEDLKTEKNVDSLCFAVLACVAATGYIAGAGIECIVAMVALYLWLPPLLGEQKVDKASSKRDLVRSIDALCIVAPFITSEELDYAFKDIKLRYADVTGLYFTDEE